MSRQPPANGIPASPTPPSLVFEYSGTTALTLVSPITRKVYRFEHAGARVDVDRRDRPWLTFVPHLRQVG